MYAERMVTISQRNCIAVKQIDAGKLFLFYENTRIYFNEGSFLNFLVEVDEWCSAREKGCRLPLVIHGSRFRIAVCPKYIEDLLFVLNEASYKLVPVLRYCREVLAFEENSSNNLTD